MREENFWCKKPRYSEVRVIARRVIARYDCISRSLCLGISSFISHFFLVHFDGSISVPLYIDVVPV